MSVPYCCPNCKTNRTRFNMIKQEPLPIKIDPQSGEIIEEYKNDQLPPIHMSYKGPDNRIQCAACGLIEDERTFIKFAELK